MAWVRPKHPKPKVEVDPTETLRPVLEYFSCSSRTSVPSASISKALSRMPPKKPLLLPQDGGFEPRPRKRQHEGTERSRSPDQQHLQREEPHRRAESRHQSAEHHDHHDHHHPRADRDTVDNDDDDDDDDDGADHYERASLRTASHWTRETSPPPPRRPPPLSSYRSSARPGAHLRLRPSRHHMAADIYASRRPASRWASATTPLEM
ncbi:MAG: hypothetical protein ALECFALPRED_010154 [Alectoria fallacina]|uniref:Uncharacterized protein n=1 Tax=Alectoria fallacina TaxID=1903189 RepID=A0A8H3J8V8_9LECA|nr:MAG: hypothetical protein ALECFALPRED_010154 [Alectoria fallacina]